MEDLKIEYADPAKLIPYSNNSRTHSQAQIKKIAASIKEFGFINPVVIDKDGGIIAGHGRIEAAAMLDLKTVPTIKAEHLTDAQKRAYVIADNRLAEDAGWDEEMLKIEIGRLSEDGYNLLLMGFEDSEIDGFLQYEAKEGLTDDDVDLSKLDKKQLKEIINEIRNAYTTTIIRDAKPTSSALHPTMKPVSLIERMIRNSSREQDQVLDLFGGSGSTLIACEKLNREARIVELDPIYCDVIIERWQEYTSKIAINKATGKEYDQHKEEREVA